jgi:hypothetical protein
VRALWSVYVKTRRRRYMEERRGEREEKRTRTRTQLNIYKLQVEWAGSTVSFPCRRLPSTWLGVHWNAATARIDAFPRFRAWQLPCHWLDRPRLPPEIPGYSLIRTREGAPFWSVPVFRGCRVAIAAGRVRLLVSRRSRRSRRRWGSAARGCTGIPPHASMWICGVGAWELDAL